MSVVYATTLKATRMTDVRNAIDAQAQAGSLVIYNAAGTVLASLTLQEPCGSVVVTGSDVDLSLTVPFSAPAVSTGAPDHASILDGNSVPVVTGLTVGTTGTNIVLNTASVTAGSSIQITSAIIRHG